MVSTEDKVYRCAVIVAGKVCDYSTTHYTGLGGHMTGHYARGEAKRPSKQSVKPIPTNGSVDLEEFSRIFYHLVNELKALRERELGWKAIAGRAKIEYEKAVRR